jgi:signal transduction histidine kinase
LNDVPPTAAAPDTRIIASLLFVFLALIGLAVAPLLLVSYLESQNERMEQTTGRAAQLNERLRLVLHQEVAELRAHLLTRDSGSLARYRNNRAHEDSLFAELSRLSPRLDDSITHRVQHLQSWTRRWHIMADSVSDAGISSERYLAHVRQQLAASDSMFGSAAALQNSLNAAIESGLDRAQLLSSRTRTAAVVLGVVALIAAIMVGWFAHRQRLLTTQLAGAVALERSLRAESERRREEIERITASRARLMRGFSHDVKNPLGAADGYLQLMQEGIVGEVSEPQRESIGRARRSLRTALNLIEDLLDLARAEAGQIEIERAPLNVTEILHEVADDYRAQAEAKDLQLTLVPPPATLMVTGDAARIRQVLSNLVSNAVKYTQNGSVTISAAFRRMAGRDGEWLVIDVTDTGAGVPADKVEHIFQEFSRLEPGAAKGAGVGLAISRRIAKAMGAEITVVSEVGRGSTFSLGLPKNV